MKKLTATALMILAYGIGVSTGVVYNYQSMRINFQAGVNAAEKSDHFVVEHMIKKYGLGCDRIRGIHY